MSGAAGTRLEAVDGERGLGQEVLVVEHVDLVDHEAQVGEGRVAHDELEGLAGPGGVQPVVGWGTRGDVGDVILYNHNNELLSWDRFVFVFLPKSSNTWPS